MVVLEGPDAGRKVPPLSLALLEFGAMYAASIWGSKAKTCRAFTWSNAHCGFDACGSAVDGLTFRTVEVPLAGGLHQRVLCTEEADGRRAKEVA